MRATQAPSLSQLGNCGSKMLPLTSSFKTLVVLALLLAPAAVLAARPADDSRPAASSAAAALHPGAPPAPRRPNSYSASLPTAVPLARL